jgi:hypothetical protein
MRKLVTILNAMLRDAEAAKTWSMTDLLELADARPSDEGSN